MVTILALLLPLLALLAAAKLPALASQKPKADETQPGNPARTSKNDAPARTCKPKAFLKHYAFALTTSLALAYLLAAETVARLSVVDILLGRIGNFGTEAKALYACLLLANLLVALFLLAVRTPEFKKPARPFAVWALLFAFLVLFRFSFFWALYQFPLQDANMVFGVLESPLGNTPSMFAAIWLRSALLPSVLVSAALLPALLGLRNSKGFLPHLVPAFVLVMLALTAYGVSGSIPLSDYYLKTRQFSPKVPELTTVYSPFYKAHYVFPDSVKIAAPAKKRNLVFVFLESMEASFQDSANGGLHGRNYIPEITELAKRNLNFSRGQAVGGGMDLNGTSWTISGIIAKLMGIPLFGDTPRYERSEIENATFKPHAKGVMDILSREGYNQLHVINSNSGFYNRGGLFEVHGKVRTKDWYYYRDVGKLPPKYKVNWGFEDSKLWEFLKEELDSLSRLPEPFALYTLTTGTHLPQGFFEPDVCPEFTPKIKTPEENFKAALLCSSKMFGEFISWAEAQKWFQTTTVVIVGDHLWPGKLFIPGEHYKVKDTKNGYKKVNLKGDIYRSWLCIFMNSALEPENRFRQFSAFDIFPSTLEALGFEVPGHALGFGRSLFSSEPTLVEKFGEDMVNRNFSQQTPEYLYLIDDAEGKWE